MSIWKNLFKSKQSQIGETRTSKTAEPSAAPNFEPPSIHEAATDGHLEWVKALLRKNPDLVFSKEENGGTPLHLAVVYGRGDVVTFLLANRADPNARDNEGGTPLHLAAKGGHRKAIPSLVRKDILESLLASGANVNATTNNGLTPLHIAAGDDQEYAVVLLLRNDANVNAVEKTLDDTPLHYAAFWGHHHMVGLLLSHKADVNPKNKKGVTPSHAAAYRGHKEVAALLRQHGGRE